MSLDNCQKQLERIEQLKSCINIRFNCPLALDFIYKNEFLELKPFKLEDLKKNKRCEDCSYKDTEECDD